MDAFLENFNYIVYVVLMMIGLYAMISKNNLIKKLVGMTIFQSAIILFYVSIGAKEGAAIPILDHHQMHVAAAHDDHADTHKDKADTHEGEHADTKIHKADKHAAGAHSNHTSAEHASTHTDKLEAPHAGEHGDHDGHHGSSEINPAKFSNPIPHVLMLTAIVVGVSTLGVALSIVQRVHQGYGSIEEDDILNQIGPNTDG